MSDGLEKFIKDNRQLFDDKEPPEHIWDNVKSNLAHRPVTPWYNNLLLWRAAAILFMGLSVYLLVPRTDFQNEGGKTALKEFSDVEAFYTKEISQKVELIEEISNGEATDEFTHDFKQLEAMYGVLKEELKNHPSKKVKDALVLNLLVRINLLNQQLHKLEEDYDGEQANQKSI